MGKFYTQPHRHHVDAAHGTRGGTRLRLDSETRCRNVLLRPSPGDGSAGV
ncbi:MAG: hypothetical protein AAGM22_18375 [Acidobacteriota bacterium]